MTRGRRGSPRGRGDDPGPACHHGMRGLFLCVRMEAGSLDPACYWRSAASMMIERPARPTTAPFHTTIARTTYGAWRQRGQVDRALGIPGVRARFVGHQRHAADQRRAVFGPGHLELHLGPVGCRAGRRLQALHFDVGRDAGASDTPVHDELHPAVHPHRRVGQHQAAEAEGPCRREPGVHVALDSAGPVARRPWPPPGRRTRPPSRRTPTCSRRTGPRRLEARWPRDAPPPIPVPFPAASVTIWPTSNSAAACAPHPISAARSTRKPPALRFADDVRRQVHGDRRRQIGRIEGA